MTPTTKARYDAEEASKELLATLHACRDLSPEMDETLADRYIERLRTLRPADSFDPAAARTDLLALLTSARGSDPAGDEALVATFLANLQAPRPAVPAYGPYGYGSYPAGPAGQYGPPAQARNNSLARMTPILIAVAIFVASMAWTNGHTVWLIFPLLFLLNAGRHNRYQRRYDKYQRRLYRDQQRAYRHDRIMRRDGPYDQLPPSGPPEIL